MSVTSEDLIVVRTLADLQQLETYIQDKEFVAYDTETTGVGKDAQIIGFSICAEESKAYYIVLAEWRPESQTLVTLETREGAKSLISQLKSKQLIMHNAVFDSWLTDCNFGISLINSVHTDTMILAHLLNENRSCGLKELGVSVFGDSAKQEQEEMKASVTKNGGSLTKACYELYKADSELLAKYGAKDAILTFKLFWVMLDDLYEQELQDFFYNDESMPLLKGPTYELNTSGLAVDLERLGKLKQELETSCLDAMAFINKEVAPHVQEKYPGTSKTTTFNIGSSKQLAWLLFQKLGEEFHILTQGGRDLCAFLECRVPYHYTAKQDFYTICKNALGQKYNGTKTVGEPWTYMACGKEALGKFAQKYKWVAKLLEYNKNKKLLTTYVEGIQERMKYGIIRPSFLQHGTTSGRYSSKNPNFQNLPRDDKRIKECIIARPGKVLIGADYSQLEPRVFASFSGDKRLLDCFKSDQDFYSVIGMEVFEKNDCTPHKEGSPEAFGIKYKALRNISKVVALSSTYGTTAFKMAPVIGKRVEEAQQVIHSYFEKFPSVEKLMLESHEQAKTEGRVTNLFGRPRRMPEAKMIPGRYGNSEHGDLPYEARNLLNLAINHRIQSTGASIMNRAAIDFCRRIKASSIKDCYIVMQIHDELVVECREQDAEMVVDILKYSMEHTVILPGVDLIAEPKIGKTLGALK